MKKLFLVLTLLSTVLLFSQEIQPVDKTASPEVVKEDEEQMIPKEMILGIITPFGITDDVKQVPNNVRKEMDLVNEIPSIYLSKITAINIFKEVKIVNEINEADLYLKGFIKQVRLGNPAARHFGGMFGAGLSGVIIKLEIFDKDKNLIDAVEITQKGSKMTASWSNKRNISSAVNATSRQVLNFIKRSVKGADSNNNLLLQLDSKDYTEIRQAIREVDQYGKFKEKEITDKISMIIKNYVSNPVNDKMAIDALSWCCIVLHKSKNKDYIPVFEDVVASNVKSKIKKYAKKALKDLKK